jgi:hypothetical protein
MNVVDWIRKGNTGCTFATLFSKNPESIGWKFFTVEEYLKGIPDDTFIVSIIFPENCNKSTVRNWALNNGFYIESTGDDTEGLRIKSKYGISWVQYFGPDSHVKTRQAPSPCLLYCRKMQKSYYFKVGFSGILHLAHAWIENFPKRKADTLWLRAHKQTEKIVGYKLTIKEAAKTTFLK